MKRGGAAFCAAGAVRNLDPPTLFGYLRWFGGAAAVSTATWGGTGGGREYDANLANRVNPRPADGYGRTMAT